MARRVVLTQKMMNGKVTKKDAARYHAALTAFKGTNVSLTALATPATK